MFKFLLAILLLISSPAWAVTQWSKAIPASGDNLTAWPAAVTAQWSILDTLLSNYRQGESLTYKNSTTVTVALGQVVASNSGNTLRIFLNDSGNTDITSANLDSGGSFSNSTTYYVYAGATSATASSSTYYISLSSSAPTGPTYYFQLGSFQTDGSGNIKTNVSYPFARLGSYNLNGGTISNGSLGATSTGSVTTGQPLIHTYTVPSGCYVTGITADAALVLASVNYTCP